MFKIFFFVACVLAIANAKRSSRIHFGRHISQREVNGKYSFVVSLQMRDQSTGKSSTCTGSLISPDTVATAAHCLCGRNLQIKVFYTTTRQGQGPNVRAAKYESNRHFQCGNHRTSQAHVDVGKVKLSRPIPGVTPIQLDCRLPQVNSEKVGMVGFGLDERRASGNLKVGVRTTRDCPPLAPGTICVQPRSGLDRTDVGDSGGPMISKQGNRLVQVGLVSGVWSVFRDTVYTFFPVKSACQWLQS